MSYTYEEHIKYKIERELEHLAWLKRNMPNHNKARVKSIERIKRLEGMLSYLIVESTYDAKF